MSIASSALALHLPFAPPITTAASAAALNSLTQQALCFYNHNPDNKVAAFTNKAISCSEESGNFEGLLEFSEPSDGQHSLQLGLNQWKMQALSALKVGAAELRSMFLKGGGIFTLAKIYQLLARKLSGKVFLEAANHQLKRDFVRKGFAGATSRYLGLRSMMALLGPVPWGTFLADIVIQMLGTDHARVLWAIYAFAQIRIARTYRLPLIAERLYSLEDASSSTSIK